MRNALINYSKKVLELKQFWMPKEFDEIEPEMAEEMKRNFLIPRTTKTDFTPFKEKFGFDVPREIKDYFDLYWHSYVDGVYLVRDALASSLLSFVWTSQFALGEQHSSYFSSKYYHM